MPELPEVEHARRSLETWLKKPVVAAHAERTRIFRGADRKAFEDLRGKARSVQRHGKQLFVQLERGAFLSHLGMTGKWVKRTSPDERYSRAWLQLKNGDYVHYVDPRMFGRLQPADAFQHSLGPDALNDRFSLQEAIGKTKLPIKVALMDQARVAGIGNIQAAEALWRARIDPRATLLTKLQWSALMRGIKASIAYTLKQEASDEITYVEEARSDNPFRVYGKKGEPCPRCHTPIATIQQGGRTTFYCPRCQKA